MERTNLINICKEWGYFYKGGIHDRVDLFKDKNILDVGMGQGPHSIFYIENGAKSYTGVDPDMELNGNNTVRNHNYNNLREKFPYSPNEIMSLFNNIHLYPCILEKLDDTHLEKYDLIIMTMVTEHLNDLPSVINACYKFLKKDGIIWSSHANYYYWNGHHELPRKLSEYDSNNLEHNKYVNWKHLYPNNPVYYQPNLNRIKINDLKYIFEKYFEISWDPDLHNDLISLIPENIKKDFPDLTIEDLISHHPVVIGKKRESILNTDLNKIEFYHPINNIEKKISNLIIYDDLICPIYPNNKYNIIYQKNLLKNIKFKNNELICELIDKKDISQQLFNSFGIHFRLYNINLKDQTKYKLSFKMKSLNEHTISKKPKIFTGIKWITSDIGLKKEYQLFEFIEEFKFSGASKYRVGIENICFNDNFIIKTICFTPLNI